MSIEKRITDLKKQTLKPSQETIMEFQAEWIKLNKEDAEENKRREEGEKA